MKKLLPFTKKKYGIHVSVIRNIATKLNSNIPSTEFIKKNKRHQKDAYFTRIRN
jgi:hypothetical protein